MRIIFTALLACLLWISNVAAQRSFYEGKTIRFVVGFSPGGAYDLGRSLFGPPGVPTDRIKILRDGFMRMMKDPDVMAEARKKGLEPNPISGDEIERLVRDLVQPPEVMQRMKTLLQN